MYPVGIGLKLNEALTGPFTVNDPRIVGFEPHVNNSPPELPGGILAGVGVRGEQPDINGVPLSTTDGAVCLRLNDIAAYATPELTIMTMRAIRPIIQFLVLVE